MKIVRSARNEVVVPWSSGIGRADRLDRAGRHAALVLLPVELAVAPHLDPAPLGERVDDRGADAVQAAGDLVAAAAELAAGVEDGHDHLQRRLVHASACLSTGMPRPLSVTVTTPSAPMRDDDRVAVAAQRLVDRVVDDLAHQVVQAALIGAADVHAGAAAHGLQPLQHLDGARRRRLGSWFSWSLPPVSTPSGSTLSTDTFGAMSASRRAIPAPASPDRSPRIRDGDPARA